MLIIWLSRPRSVYGLTRDFNFELFLVNGKYTSWTSWTECSVSCGNGTKMRQRDCANPSPKYGGKDCSSLGVSEEIVGCLKDPCPRKF